MHNCGPEDAENIGKLLRAMYDLAATLMPNADWVEHCEAAPGGVA